MPFGILPRQGEAALVRALLRPVGLRVERLVVEFVLGNPVWIAVAAIAALSLATSVHIVLNKHDPRSAAAWLAFVWLLPILGAMLYVEFGLNTVARIEHPLRPRAEEPQGCEPACVPEDAQHLEPLMRIGERLTGKELTGRNAITPLDGADAAFPVIFEAIDGARRSVGVSSYMFKKDYIGLRMIAALAAAASRGVEVRILLDTVGILSMNSVFRELRKQKLNVVRFMNGFHPSKLHHMNNRNHRKIIVVDGAVGFTGSLNIHEPVHAPRSRRLKMHDLHFRLDGPVVRHLTETFIDDWAYATGERIAGEGWRPELPARGSIAARGLADGPDREIGVIRWTMLGAIGCARKSVRIATPYFVPDAWLVSALNVAALRGVNVEIVVPGVSDSRTATAAGRDLAWQVLSFGARLYETNHLFDHSKVMVVDGAWVTAGSANIDPRSLDLNFEFNVEVFDTGFAKQMDELIDSKIAFGREVRLEDVDKRPLRTRLRDGVARMLAPYF